MAKVQRTPPTAGELEKMLSKHLSFEINRFRLTVSLWGAPKYAGPIDAMVRESCLIHMRLLLDFFYPRYNPASSKFRDVFVTDYLDRNQMSPELLKLLTPPAWLNDYRDQLDWRLAHLTLKRIDFEQNPCWSPEPQFGHLERLIGEFLKALPANRAALFNPNMQG
jgi:hypothetical protein